MLPNSTGTRLEKVDSIAAAWLMLQVNCVPCKHMVDELQAAVLAACSCNGGGLVAARGVCHERAGGLEQAW